MFCLSMLTIAMMQFVHATNNLHFNISFHNNTDTEVFGNTFRCDSNASTIYTTDYSCDCTDTQNCAINFFDSTEFSTLSYNNVSVKDSCFINFINNTNTCIMCSNYTIYYTYDVEENCNKRFISLILAIVVSVSVCSILICGVYCCCFRNRNKINYNKV